MRILILGGDGMLGHRLFKRLRSGHEARVTLRLELSAYEGHGMFSPGNSYPSVDVRSMSQVVEVMADFRPQAVVNCVGIVKQRSAAKESIPSLEINALFPHRMAVMCKAAGSRLVHLSTDCVFSGRGGNYTESDPCDADDLYGMSKYLGEVHDTHCLTLRTSMIGRELSRKKGLVEWFIAQGGRLKGYKKAIFSGFTTAELSRIIEKMLVEHPDASGLYHVSSEPISKFDLLTLIKEKMGLTVEIEPDDTFRCDRSLDSTRFRGGFNYAPPSWDTMAEELADEFKGEEK